MCPRRAWEAVNNHDAFLTDLDFYDIGRFFVSGQLGREFKIVDFDLACIAHDTPVEGRIAADTRCMERTWDKRRRGARIDWG
jgi:hypothetical protein